MSVTRVKSIAPRTCDECGVAYQPKRSDSRFHDATCAQRARRKVAKGGPPTSPSAVQDRPRAAYGSEDGALERSVRAELESAQRVDTYLGQSALAIARQVDAGRGTDQAVTSLIRELRATMAAATAGAGAPGDPVDELKERRRARIHGR